MPFVRIERLPFPDLKTYTCGSVLALSACIYFATQAIKDPNAHLPVNIPDSEITKASNASTPDRKSMSVFMTQIFAVLIREPICVWVSYFSRFIPI